jgi:hypothetical protein
VLRDERCEWVKKKFTMFLILLELRAFLFSFQFYDFKAAVRILNEYKKIEEILDKKIKKMMMRMRASKR